VGVSKEAVEATVSDAFAFYLKEKALPVPEQRKKQVQRFGRAERRLIGILQGDRRLSEVTRKDARAWRDERLAAGKSPATIRREKNDISAVISLAISELDTTAENLFRGLKIVGASAGKRDDREPLPKLVIDGMYEALSDHAELLIIWTLLDFTGARPSEVRMLRIDEFRLDADVPHIVIETREGRTLKTQWSTREVPLVGEALEVALRLVGVATDRELAFPGYAGTGGMDRMSAALNGRIRKLSADPKHVAYSLRHNMKDRMREAEVFPETAKAIEGHAYSSGQDASYGGGVTLRKKAEAVEKALISYRI
jgi:integrase